MSRYLNLEVDSLRARISSEVAALELDKVEYSDTIDTIVRRIACLGRKDRDTERGVRKSSPR